MPGVVRVMDPKPYNFSFGTTDAEIVANNLKYLEEVIEYEGPKNIAAMFIETVTGTNGILPPPKGYLTGLKRLLEKHGILLVTDEVMCGFSAPASSSPSSTARTTPATPKASCPTS